MSLTRYFSKALVLGAFLLLSTAVAAQHSPLRLEADPESVMLQGGATLPIAARVVDVDGETVTLDVRFGAPCNVLGFRDGVLQG